MFEAAFKYGLGKPKQFIALATPAIASMAGQSVTEMRGADGTGNVSPAKVQKVDLALGSNDNELTPAKKIKNSEVETSTK